MQSYSPASHQPGGRPRARGLGVPFDGTCGHSNAITDVPGVEVGYHTHIKGNEESVVGRGPVRTGVTAIFPRGRADPLGRVWAGVSSFNGVGEMTGAHWIREGGYFTGPVCITNTHSVGMVHHAAVKWLTRQPTYHVEKDIWLLPVVAETCDGCCQANANQSPKVLAVASLRRQADAIQPMQLSGSA